MIKRIIILASGSGTNAENIIKYFQDKNSAEVRYVLSNKKNAMVLERAKRLKIDNASFDKSDFFETDKVMDLLVQHGDYIVLAGFLWKVPLKIIQKFPNRIINIHPALLPKYGGKGMYGAHVHKAVVANKESESGISIHYVNEFYDEGTLIFQAKTEVLPSDNAEDVAQKVHQLEYEHFPRVIEKIVLGND
jgi:phosphoribosylglycinamide formyltransferase-1